MNDDRYINLRRHLKAAADLIDAEQLVTDGESRRQIYFLLESIFKGALKEVASLRDFEDMPYSY